MSEDSDNGANGKDNLVARYFKELVGIPLLRPEQELEQAMRLEGAHQQIVYDLCRHRYKKKPKLPGLDSLEHCLRPYSESEGFNQKELHNYRTQLMRMRAPKRVKEISDVIYTMVPHPRYELVRSAAEHALDQEDERKTLTTALETDLRCVTRVRNSFAMSNLRLVIDIAKRYSAKAQILDLIQEGNLGLLKAVDRFDYRRGFRFSTYATWWIRHAVTRYLHNEFRTIRLPVHAEEYLATYDRNRRELCNALGREPGTEEVLAQMLSGQPSEDHVKKHHSIIAVADLLSVDQPVNPEDGNSFIAFLQDMSAEDPLKKVLHDESEREVRCAVYSPDLLSPREIDVIEMRYFRETPLTLEQAGKRKGVTRERIRQIQAKALEKLKRRLQWQHGEAFAF